MRVFLLVPLIFAACASGRVATDRDFKRIEQKLNDLRNFQAEQTNEIASLQTRLRNLSGRVDEVEFRQRAGTGTDIKDLQSDIKSLQQRVPPPAIVPELTLEADELLSKKLDQRAGELFSAALADVRNGHYLAAQNRLREALDLNNGREGTAQILFWQGVCYDGVGDSRKALESYNQVVSSFPKHERAALALLRLGSVFIRLGDSETAKLTFQKLINEFPKSSEALRARERLRDIRG